MRDRFWPESKSCLPDQVWPCIRACISGGTVFGMGGPILAAKISPGRPILAAKIGPGDHFSQKLAGRTTFGGDRFWCDRPVCS